MYGPNWSNPARGVTGEKQPNYVTVTDEDGSKRTLVGEDADRHREAVNA